MFISWTACNINNWVDIKNLKKLLKKFIKIKVNRVCLSISTSLKYTEIVEKICFKYCSDIYYTIYEENIKPFKMFSLMNEYFSELIQDNDKIIMFNTLDTQDFYFYNSDKEINIGNTLSGSIICYKFIKEYFKLNNGIMKVKSLLDLFKVMDILCSEDKEDILFLEFLKSKN
uniref:Uncharacterized protein n=1 Tax=viral metagenome TaxID=1070528 RepID=A0A6C0AF57_9ZZZZ